MQNHIFFTTNPVFSLDVSVFNEMAIVYALIFVLACFFVAAVEFSKFLLGKAIHWYGMFIFRMLPFSDSLYKTYCRVTVNLAAITGLYGICEFAAYSAARSIHYEIWQALQDSEEKNFTEVRFSEFMSFIGTKEYICQYIVANEDFSMAKYVFKQVKKFESEILEYVPEGCYAKEVYA